jgi:hypothetical protein
VKLAVQTLGCALPCVEALAELSAGLCLYCSLSLLCHLLPLALLPHLLSLVLLRRSLLLPLYSPNLRTKLSLRLRLHLETR